MVIAGEPSGDQMAGELVQELRSRLMERQSDPTPDGQPLHASLAPRFFGAGGRGLERAGVEVLINLSARSVIGPADVARNYRFFSTAFWQLIQAAEERQPDLLILVDYSHFNHRFAREIRRRVRRAAGPFRNWRPRIVKYVSPQVWASRPGRADSMPRDLDLLLCLFPFEREWYARRVPRLRTAFVGHPIIDRYAGRGEPIPPSESPPWVVLLPGSRRAELARHLPPVLEAAGLIAEAMPVRFRMVLPSEELAAQVRSQAEVPPGVEIQVGNLPEALEGATLAIASTGSVTLECARFQVPTVALYKTSWLTYELGKRLIHVPYLAMPNLLAEEPLFPELIQHRATGKGIAEESLQLLRDPARRGEIRRKLGQVIASLGGRGATRRAAEAIVALLDEKGAEACQEGLAGS